MLSVDEKGRDLSRYGDDFWDYRAFETGATFNFGSHKLSDANVQLTKKAMFLVLYHLSCLEEESGVPPIVSTA